jgi:hypothetical protein
VILFCMLPGALLSRRPTRSVVCFLFSDVFVLLSCLRSWFCLCSFPAVLDTVYFHCHMSTVMFCLILANVYCPMILFCCPWLCPVFRDIVLLSVTFVLFYSVVHHGVLFSVVLFCCPRSCSEVCVLALFFAVLF